MDPIRLKIPKMGVITEEPPNHAQVCEYPPRVLLPTVSKAKRVDSLWVHVLGYVQGLYANTAQCW